MEINDCHQETLPGYYKYLKDLNYNVEVFTNLFAEDAFTNIGEDLPVWSFTKKEMLEIFRKYDFKKYKYIIFNSKMIYEKDEVLIDIYDYLPQLPKTSKNIICVQHHIDKINEFVGEKQIILANPAHNKDFDALVVNPHYFGNIQITPKSELTTFISIGEINPVRRNSSLLIESIKALINKNITNFKVVIIGSGKLDSLPEEIRSHIEIKGRLPFDDMYKELENSDFILPLLDPEIEAQKRYMKDGTSGTFQLVYGFLKPCIIHSVFADIYGFDKTNSLIYEENSNLVNTMQKAINMTNQQYNIIQNNLKNKVENIEKESLENLRGMLE